MDGIELHDEAFELWDHDFRKIEGCGNGKPNDFFNEVLYQAIVSFAMVNKQQQFDFSSVFSIFALKNIQELALFEPINSYWHVI